MDEPADPPDDDEESAIVAAFLTELLEDRSLGRSLPREHYERRFPGFEAVIAAEHARLESEAREPGSEAPAGTTRYRVEDELGRGGMGRIYSVWDGALRRRIAMKVLREGAADATAPRLLRFVEEAQVTAQLDHPGVVPVHDLGIDDSGSSFFTMSLVRGRNFEQILALVHARSEGWTPIKAIGVLLKACEAVAYAHSKGVLHRDLKPSNIMVGGFGETYVVDWGLARVQPADGPRAAEPDAQPATEVTGGGTRVDGEEPDAASARMTGEGDILGTPAYMAPEQARGERARIGPRSDVYSLGAILYHVLSGQPPHARGVASRREILAAVSSGPPAALAEAAPAAPAELVSVCAKAMARDPGERYPDALALAEDLHAFLENRVVRAHRSGAIVELRKWVQRNRLAAAASATALLALVAGTAISWSYKSRSDADARKAEAGYSSALEAVDKMLTGVASEALAGVPGAEPVRRELLEEARRLYVAFLDEHGARPGLRARVANAHHSLGVIHGVLGEYDASDKEYRAAASAYEALLAESPEDTRVAQRLAQTRMAMGRLAAKRGRATEADAIFREVLDSARQALERRPGDLAMLAITGKLEHDLAFLAWKRGARREALGRARRAVETDETLAQRSRDAHSLCGLAHTCNTLGSMLVESDMLTPADAALQRAVAACEEVLAREPRHAEARELLASAYVTFDYVYTAREQVEPRKQAVEKALDLYTQLAAEAPRVPDHHSQMAIALNNRALIAQNEGALEAALSDLAEAVRQQRIALGTVPDHVEFRQRLRNHLINEMWTLYRLGRYADIPERCRALLENDRQEPKSGRDAAAFYWMAAGLAGADPLLAEVERTKRRGELIEKGVESLRAAISHGLRDASRLDGRELDAVRDDPRVEAVLAELANARAGESRPVDASGAKR